MARYEMEEARRDSAGRACEWTVLSRGVEIGRVTTSDHGYQPWLVDGVQVGFPVIRRELACEALWRRDVQIQLELALGRAGNDEDLETLDSYQMGQIHALQQALSVLKGEERIR